MPAAEPNAAAVAVARVCARSLNSRAGAGSGSKWALVSNARLRGAAQRRGAPCWQWPRKTRARLSQITVSVSNAVSSRPGSYSSSASLRVVLAPLASESDADSRVANAAALLGGKREWAASREQPRLPTGGIGNRVGGMQPPAILRSLAAPHRSSDSNSTAAAVCADRRGRRRVCFAQDDCRFPSVSR